jgi:hypothetical protein
LNFFGGKRSQQDIAKTACAPSELLLIKPPLSPDQTISVAPTPHFYLYVSFNQESIAEARQKERAEKGRESSEACCKKEAGGRPIE